MLLIPYLNYTLFKFIKKFFSFQCIVYIVKNICNFISFKITAIAHFKYVETQLILVHWYTKISKRNIIGKPYAMWCYITSYELVFLKSLGIVHKIIIFNRQFTLYKTKKSFYIFLHMYVFKFVFLFYCRSWHLN